MMKDRKVNLISWFKAGSLFQQLTGETRLKHSILLSDVELSVLLRLLMEPAAKPRQKKACEGRCLSGLLLALLLGCGGRPQIGHRYLLSRYL